MTDFAGMLAEGYGFTDAAVVLGAAIEPGAIEDAIDRCLPEIGQAFKVD